MKFNEMYPKERFYAADLQGRPWTLTFSNPAVTYKTGEDGKRDLGIPPIWHFVETPKVMPAVLTNGVCARAIMQALLGKEAGEESDNWHGHKITVYPAEDTSGFSEDGLCIRVKGSPELQRPLEFRAQIGQRKKTFKMVPTGNGVQRPAVDPVTGEVAPTPPANQPATAPQEALTAPPAAETAPEPFAADSAIQGQAPESDEEPPGRGPLFAADDPNRPASNREKGELADLRAGLSDEQDHELMKGVDLGEATKGEVEALIARAREAVA
jgi:hypothetical protein